MKKGILKLNKAFTLVEILIVVIIIGILMWALLPRLKGAQERARDTARKANLSQISTALEMYFNDYGTYPTGKCWNELAASLVPQYMNDIPRDPQKWRKTYWTTTNWCSSWNYAYTAMYKNGSQSGGSVLIANVEAEWRVGNYILKNSGITFNGSTTTNKRLWKDVASEKPSNTDTLQTTDEFNSTEYAQKAICQSTKVNANVSDKWKWCWTTVITDWEAKANKDMVYVRFN